jgi:CMP-N-acetylneuraminic acid synthetase
MRQFGVVALVPFKVNSERVPRKNFRILGDKPLYAWIIDTLIKVPQIEKIVINTDARHLIDETACLKTDKVIIRSRPEAICGDLVSMNKVIEDDLQNISATTYIMTHTTNPFLSVESISAGLERYQKGLRDGYDSLFSVKKIQTRLYTQDGCPVNHDPKQLVRTQDLPPLFEENSNLYVFSSESFGNSGARIGKTPILFETPMNESMDIDTEDDWIAAEMLATARVAEGVGL